MTKKEKEFLLNILKTNNLKIHIFDKEFVIVCDLDFDAYDYYCETCFEPGHYYCKKLTKRNFDEWEDVGVNVIIYKGERVRL